MQGCSSRPTSVCPSVGQSVSLNRGENGGAAVARQPGMLGGGDDISISIIGSHEAERCSTEAPREEEEEEVGDKRPQSDKHG